MYKFIFLSLLIFYAVNSRAQDYLRYRVPRLIQPEKTDYNPDDIDTYAVYDEFNTVINPALSSSRQDLKSLQEDNRNFCLWHEYDKTCLGYVTRNDWNREYYGFEGNEYLEDEATGRRYAIKAVRGLPLNRLFMAQSPAGSFVSFVLEFERIPDDVKTINYIDPPSTPFNAPGADYGGAVYSHMSVNALKQNTNILKYVEVKVVK